jgi:hydrogenase 3 maturation protease
MPAAGLVVLCIGNDLRGDDGAGPLVAAALCDRFPGRVFDGGQAPESFLGPIRRARPGSVVIVDAADFGAAPGEMRVFSATEAASAAPGIASLLGTHAPPLSILMELIAGETGATAHLVAIQAGTTAFGAAMTAEVAAAARSLVDELAILLKEDEP